MMRLTTPVAQLVKASSLGVGDLWIKAGIWQRLSLVVVCLQTDQASRSLESLKEPGDTSQSHQRLRGARCCHDAKLQHGPHQD